jgi:hypothetical protein
VGGGRRVAPDRQVPAVPGRSTRPPRFPRTVASRRHELLLRGSEH